MLIIQNLLDRMKRFLWLRSHPKIHGRGCANSYYRGGADHKEVCLLKPMHKSPCRWVKVPIQANKCWQTDVNEMGYWRCKLEPYHFGKCEMRCQHRKRIRPWTWEDRWALEQLLEGFSEVTAPDGTKVV